MTDSLCDNQKNSNTRAAIYQVVHQIPAGKVATYGQVATLAGIAGAARHVGTVLRKLPKDTQLPWHRVINAQGKLSVSNNRGGYQEKQQQRLEQEGVIFSNKKINLREYGWDNRGRMG